MRTKKTIISDAFDCPFNVMDGLYTMPVCFYTSEACVSDEIPESCVLRRSNVKVMLKRSVRRQLKRKNQRK